MIIITIYFISKLLWVIRDNRDNASGNLVLHLKNIRSVNQCFFLRDPVIDATSMNARMHGHPTPMSTSAYSPLWTYTLPLWAPPKNWVGLANLEIDEVTIGVSLLTGTLPTTERIAPLNPGINRKMRTLMSSQGLEPRWAGPQQGTQLDELHSVHWSVNQCSTSVSSIWIWWFDMIRKDTLFMIVNTSFLFAYNSRSEAPFISLESNWTKNQS
jgi:hypothetical protein